MKARILLLETHSISSLLLNDRFFFYPSLNNHSLSVFLSRKNDISWKKKKKKGTGLACNSIPLMLPSVTIILFFGIQNWSMHTSYSFTKISFLLVITDIASMNIHMQISCICARISLLYTPKWNCWVVGYTHVQI